MSTPAAAATTTRIEVDSEACPLTPDGAWNPWMTRNATSAHQKSTLRTTAEPIPWVPRAKPVSAPETPDWVRRR